MSDYSYGNINANMRKVLVGSLFLLGALITGLSIAAAVYAADFDVTLDTKIKVTAFDKLTVVDTRITVTNNVNSETPDSITLPAFGSGIKSLLAVYTDDDGLIDASYDASTNTIFVPLIRSNKGEGNSWSVDVSYSSENIDTLGDTHVVMLEGYPGNLGDFKVKSESRTLTSDLSLGIGTRVGKTVPTSSIGIGVQSLAWSEDGSIDYATGIVFGDVALADTVVTTKLENNSIFFKKYTVVIAPDDNQQRVYFDSITPKPRNVRVDIDGNILAEYRLGPLSSTKVEAKATVLVNNFTYDLSNANDHLSDEEKAELTASLINTDRWPARNFSNVDASVPDVDLIRAIINETLKQKLDTFGSDEFAQVVGRTDYFVGALRGYGIPARAIRGKLVQNGQTKSYAWAEVYLSGMGWLTVDHMSDSQSFRTADARYVALLVRNQDDSFPPSRINETQVNYKEGTQLPSNDDLPIIASRTYMILPGLGIRISSVDMPSGRVVDNTALLIENDRLTNLGSIAPLQKVTTRDPVWGSKALGTTNVLFGVVDTDGEFTETARVVSTISWKPFIALVIAGVLGFVSWYIWKHRKPSNKPKKPKKAKKTRFTRKAKMSPQSHAAIQSRQKERPIQTPRPTAPAPQRTPQPTRQKLSGSTMRPPYPPRASNPDAYKSSGPSRPPRRKKPPTLIQ